MFAKIYRYKVRENDFEESQRISKKADKVYEEYGREKKPITLYRKNKGLVEIVLIEFYKSKRDYRVFINKINNDKRIKRLWDSFIGLVYGREVNDEEFYRAD